MQEEPHIMVDIPVIMEGFMGIITIHILIQLTEIMCQVVVPQEFLNLIFKMKPQFQHQVTTSFVLWADNFIKSISQSKIALNLSQGHNAKYYSSDRFAQLIGNGLLVIIDKKTRFSDFFNKDEIVTYSDINDLSKKIEKFTNNDVLRQKIAKKGRDKYFKFFNSSAVINPQSNIIFAVSIFFLFTSVLSTLFRFK